MHVVTVIASVRVRVKLYTQSLDLQSGPMSARNNGNSFTYFLKSVSQFENVLIVSQKLIRDETPS